MTFARFWPDHGTAAEAHAVISPVRHEASMKSNARHPRAFLIILSAVALATIPAPLLAEVPPEAQPAFNKGVLAAQQQEWDVALHSFQDARKIAPTSPEIYYNLGLTESKIPGRELRAIAWLTAYLAAEPAAPNSAAVIREIDGLDIKSQSNLTRLVKDAANRENMGQVLQILALISSDRREAEFDVIYADLNLAKAQASVGNTVAEVEMVKAAAAAVTSETALYPSIYETVNDIAKQLAQGGGFGAAVEVAELGEPIGVRSYGHLNPTQKSEVWEDIAEAQAKAGDYAGASNTTERISVEVQKQSKQRVIAEAQAKAGDYAGASNTAERLSEEASKQEVQRVIAAAKAGEYAAWAPTPANTPAISASDLLKAVLGDSDDDNAKILNAPIFLNPTDYLSSLSSSDPHDVVKEFYPVKGIVEDWSSAGKPLVLFCALAQAAATMAEGERVTQHYTKAVIAQTLAHAAPRRQR